MEGVCGGGYIPVSLYEKLILLDIHGALFLIRWLKVMGRGDRKWGKEGIDEWSAGEFHVRNQPQFGNYPHIIISFFPLSFFLSLGNVGTSFGLAERGIQL